MFGQAKTLCRYLGCNLYVFLAALVLVDVMVMSSS